MSTNHLLSNILVQHSTVNKRKAGKITAHLPFSSTVVALAEWVLVQGRMKSLGFRYTRNNPINTNDPAWENSAFSITSVVLCLHHKHSISNTSVMWNEFNVLKRRLWCLYQLLLPLPTLYQAAYTVSEGHPPRPKLQISTLHSSTKRKGHTGV